MSRNQHSKTRRSQTTTTARKRKQPSRTTSTGMTRSPQRSASSSSTVRNAGSSVAGMASSALQSVKSHPMPYALAGVGVVCAGAGIAWLITSTAKTMIDAEGNPLPLPRRMQTTIKDASQTVTRASRMANEKASQLAHDALVTSRQLEQSVESAVREHPIAIGAALLAAGAAIGFAIPRSSFEDNWLGRERDQMVSSAQRMAKGAVQKVESLAKQVAGNSSNSVAHA